MKDDIIINKTETIKRCIERINEEYDGKYENLENYTKQDSIRLNIQRMCEATLDLGLHYIKEKKLKIPQTNKEIYKILEEKCVIDKKLSENLKGMAGFRNIAVHNYQQLNLNILEKVIENHLYDPIELSKIILEAE